MKDLTFEKYLSFDSSKANLDFVVELVGNDITKFKKLMDLALNASPIVAMRAAHVAERISRANTEMITPYIDIILSQFFSFKHQGQKRAFTKAFSRLHFTEDQLGRVVDICFNCIDNPKESIAVQAFSMEILFNTSLKIPELRNELQLILEERMDEGSPGWKSRARNYLHQLAKLKKLNESN